MTFLFAQQPPAARAPGTPQAPGVRGAPGAPVLAPATAGLGSLNAQLAELTVQHSALKAQWDGLRRQLDNMLQTNPARPGIQQEWANVGSQIAQVDGQIAAIRARIEQRQGGDAFTLVPPGNDGPIHRGDPDLPIAGGIAIMLALILPLSVAYAIRMLRRTPVPKAQRTDDFGPRFDRLE